ncbi:PQQ-dependent sugar dehydrogenase [Stenotrophomonas koreensis]|uniref:PQQ-dependent sugar dehydrogenase n=1 Tax=Stenotrophomonas koreensis TaxID=266128 RepID=UPI00339A8CDD
MTRTLALSIALALLPLGACAQTPDPAADAAVQADNWPFTATEVARFAAPWAMTFLPDGRALVTEKAGVLKLTDVANGQSRDVAGVPAVAFGGQGGLGDVITHPDFAGNRLVYLSYAEEGADDTRGAAVARARLVEGGNGPALEGLEVIWRQVPYTTGGGHYGHRLAFGPDGKLWISSSERQKFDPAQDMASNLGKIIRLNDDGSVPADNPFADQPSPANQVWSLGHRNALGLAFDGNGQLWEHEMGPKGGDELNRIVKGGNYGYPLVSNGDHYDGRVIPDHDTRPEFIAPTVTWRSVISPAGFIIYNGSAFPQWQGSGFIGGLSSKSLVRVSFDGETAREAERFAMGERIREVEQGPDGAIWLLQDGDAGRLLKLSPK